MSEGGCASARALVAIAGNSFAEGEQREEGACAMLHKRRHDTPSARDLHGAASRLADSRVRRLLTSAAGKTYRARTYAGDASSPHHFQRFVRPRHPVTSTKGHPNQGLPRAGVDVPAVRTREGRPSGVERGRVKGRRGSRRLHRWLEVRPLTFGPRGRRLSSLLGVEVARYDGGHSSLSGSK